MKHSLQYGCWRPAFALSEAFSQPAAPRYPQQIADDLYWLTGLPREGDRQVLMQRHKEHERCLLPAPFSIRSRVHEYGGRAHLLLPGCLIFVNQDDQRLYRLELVQNQDPVPLTPVQAVDGSDLRFADPVAVDRQWLVAVAEYHHSSGSIDNCLVAVNFTNPESEPCILARGADFYAGFVCAGTACAWIEWDQPAMQWDQSRLLTAVIDWDDGRPVLKKVRTLVDEPECSVCPPIICADGSLVFAMDRQAQSGQVEDFSNLYRYNQGFLEVLGPQPADIGEPFWVFGQHRYCESRAGEILAIRTLPDREVLQLIDLKTGGLQTLETAYVGFSQLQPTGTTVLIIATSDVEPVQVIALHLDDFRCEPLLQSPAIMAAEQVSRPQALRFVVANQETAHAWFYAPCNPCYQAPAGSLPALLVMVHGGPTSRSRRGFALEKQIWTSLGFAVLDINHRGSSGYGRSYRQRLLGGWGIIEIEDVVAAINDVTGRGLADASRVFIRGSSAGGYTVLRALTEYPQVFTAGACYYGIANLAILARITHKFEGCYLDRLLGEPFNEQGAEEPGNVYRDRSPIHHMECLASPMIVFQGLQDNVVPPALSRELATHLQHQGIDYQYIEYPDEGHGFRRAATRVDSLSREIDFFQHVLQCTNTGARGSE